MAGGSAGKGPRRHRGEKWRRWPRGKKHWSVRIIYRLKPGRKTGPERRAKGAARWLSRWEKRARGHSVTRRRKICCHKEDCLVLMKKHYHDDIAPSFTAPACIYGWGDKKDRSVRILPSSRNWVCSLMELWPNGRGSNLIIPLSH